MQLAELLPEDPVERVPVPAGPPAVAGAQWDEVQGWWERWDEADGRWHVVGAVDLPRRPAELSYVIDLRDSVRAGER